MVGYLGNDPSGLLTTVLQTVLAPYKTTTPYIMTII